MWTNDVQNVVNLTQCAQQAVDPIEKWAAPFIGDLLSKLLSMFVKEGLLATGGVAVTYISTKYYTRITTTKIVTEHIQQDAENSLVVIFEEIDDKIKSALTSIGGGQISAAIELKATIDQRLGPLVQMIEPVSKAVKGLDEAGKGKVAQEMICICGKCTCGVPGTCDCRARVTVTTSTPSASASAAAGGGAAAAAASVTGGSGDATTTPNPPPSGGNIPAISPARLCDCGQGKLEDAKPKPKSQYEREMSVSDQITVTRKAIEAVAEIWRRETIIPRLRAIHVLLSKSAPGRKKETAHVLGLFQGEIVKIKETKIKR